MDVGERVIFRGRDRVRLERQPFDVLVLLLRRPGQLVTRTEIEEHIWPGGVALELDTRINTCVRKVREALRDSPRSPRFIETVAREGYRFVGTLQDLEGEAGDAPANQATRSEPADEAPRFAPAWGQPVPEARLSHDVWASLGLVAVAAAATAIAMLTQAVGVAAILYGAFFFLAVLSADAFDARPVAKGAIAFALVAAMAYVPSAWTLAALSGEIVNFDALRPAALYPFVTGLQFLPLFVLVLFTWALRPNGSMSAMSRWRTWFWGVACLLLSVTVLAVATYSGQVEVWRAGLPSAPILAGYYGAIVAANLAYGWIGYRVLNTSSSGGSRSLLVAGALIYLVVLVCAIGIGEEQNRLNRYHLSTRRPQEYRAATPEALSQLLNGPHQHRIDVAEDLRSLLVNPEFVDALRSAPFYRADLDERFQLGQRAVTFGYATVDPNGRPVFQRVRFPQELALTLGFRAAR